MSNKTGWIRHRGSKAMPKRLEGMRFAAKLRDGSVHVVSSDSDYLKTPFAWVHKGYMDEIMQYRIIGKIEQTSWPEDRIDVIGQNGNTGEHYAIDTSPERVENDAENVHVLHKHGETTEEKCIRLGIDIDALKSNFTDFNHGPFNPDSTSTNKYQRTVKGVTIDVYDVLVAFGVTCPAMAHAIKKMLMPGMRGSKDAEQDKREAIQAIERSIELHKE